MAVTLQELYDAAAANNPDVNPDRLWVQVCTQSFSLDAIEASFTINDYVLAAVKLGVEEHAPFSTRNGADPEERFDTPQGRKVSRVRVLRYCIRRSLEVPEA